MKIGHPSDWHIIQKKKKVPYKWQANKFKKFFRTYRKIITNERIVKVFKINLYYNYYLEF